MAAATELMPKRSMQTLLTWANHYSRIFLSGLIDGRQLGPGAVAAHHADAPGRVFLFLFLVLLLLPSSRAHVFEGLPLSGIAEFVTLFLLLPLCASGALRRLHARTIESALGKRWLTVVPAILLLAIGAKLLLLIAGDRSGFAGCYQSVTAPSQVALTCERSYENPFFRDSVTRIDDAIAFAPATWNLSFFNSLRFNYYPWVKDNIERTRMPFAARWRGEIDHPAPTNIAITYVGQGSVHIGDVGMVTLPPAYRRAETIDLKIPAGRHRFALEYRFDDGARVGDGPRVLRGPYASLYVRVDGAPLRTIEPKMTARVAGGFVDLAIASFVSSVVWCFGGLLRRDLGLGAIACVSGAMLSIDPTVAMSPVSFLGSMSSEIPAGLPRGIGLTLVTGLLFILIVRRPSRRLLLMAYLAIGWASAFRQDFLMHGFHAVFYRGAGGDWLTYESFARTILDTGSLEAGEPIFFYQPFFRYIVFLSHAMLGDGDTLIALLAQTLLIWSVFSMSASLLPQGVVRGAPRYLGIAVGVLLIALVTSDPVSWMIHEGASEYPTWIAFLVMFPRLFASGSVRDWWLGALMAGLSVITRMNLAIGMGWMYAVFLNGPAKSRPAFTVRSVLAIAALAALPAAHNAWYGRALSVLPEEHAVATTLPMPPSRWLRVFDDAEARTQALLQLNAITYAGRITIGSMVPTEASHSVIAVVFRGLQAVWIVAAVQLFAIASHTTAALRAARLLWILPVMFLVLHLFYQVRDGHPRFIVIGYLAMGAVTMLALRACASGRRPLADRPVARRQASRRQPWGV